MFLCDSVGYSTQAPMAITEAPDGGFTIAGYAVKRNSQDKDAFVTHFMLKAISAVLWRKNSISKSIKGFHVHASGGGVNRINQRHD